MNDNVMGTTTTKKKIKKNVISALSHLSGGSLSSETERTYCFTQMPKGQRSKKKEEAGAAVRFRIIGVGEEEM